MYFWEGLEADTHTVCSAVSAREETRRKPIPREGIISLVFSICFLLSPAFWEETKILPGKKGKGILYSWALVSTLLTDLC